MKSKIKGILLVEPGLKARRLASKTGIDKTEISRILHGAGDEFFQDADYGWHCRSAIVLEFPEECWITADDFEDCLVQSGYVTPDGIHSFAVMLPNGCKMMLDATARLLALVNQLASAGIPTSIDFSACRSSKTYLNRAGFFDHLHADINVMPRRPKTSAALRYQGNSGTLVEFGVVDPSSRDIDLPRRLTKSFVDLTNDQYEVAAFTIFSELFENVCEHSQTKIPGFAALQKYEGKKPHKPHIQTIVSDSGLGIAATLKQELQKHYPDLFQSLDLTRVESDVLLIQKALTEGSLSQFGASEGRGLGLRKSNDYAIKYNALVSVRQHSFALKLIYKDGEFVRTLSRFDLPEIQGTHVCFDFVIDRD